MFSIILLPTPTLTYVRVGVGGNIRENIITYVRVGVLGNIEGGGGG
jgi:hypothetical protein